MATNTDERFYVMLDVTQRDASEHPNWHSVVGWFPVVDDDAGIVAYFGSEQDADNYVAFRSAQ